MYDGLFARRAKHHSDYFVCMGKKVMGKCPVGTRVTCSLDTATLQFVRGNVTTCPSTISFTTSVFTLKHT